MKSEIDTARALASMDPLLPDIEGEALAALNRSIYIEAGRLSAALPAKETRQAMATLIREMNSYYSNLIEGHKTLPRDIERALGGEFADDERRRLNQHLTAAHVRVEQAMEQRLANEPELDIHGVEFLCWLHSEFYRNLPAELQYGLTRSGKKYSVEAGNLRAFNVDVGRHTPPDHRCVHACLQRFAQFYGNATRSAGGGLAAAAAAHHRLTWIHPFGDGNGRVARLFSHAALMRQQVDGLGLWTLSRGLARFRDRYFDRLSAADRPRHDDYDGREALSARGLSEFCVFFLQTVLDQIRFMGQLLELPALLSRIENYVHREAAHIGKHRNRVVRLLRAAAAEGQIPRGRVADIVGLKPSAARQVTKLALDEGLLCTPSPKGPLGIAFPAKVLDSYFPRLFLDLPVDE